MNFCIEVNAYSSIEMQLDALSIKKYLNKMFLFNKLTNTQMKLKIIDIINNEKLIRDILKELDISYEYFIQLLYVSYTHLFTTSFINKHIKKTYNKYL
jgi:hypothetical protein